MGGVHLISTQRLLAASWAIFSPALCLALGNRQASEVPVPLRLGCTEPESRPLTLRLALDYFIFIFSLFSSLLHWTGAFQRGSKSLRWAQPEGLHFGVPKHCPVYFISIPRDKAQEAASRTLHSNWPNSSHSPTSQLQVYLLQPGRGVYVLPWVCACVCVMKP